MSDGEWHEEKLAQLLEEIRQLSSRVAELESTVDALLRSNKEERQ